MNRIRFLRLKSGMKQAELAEKIMVSQSSLSGYENGKFEPDSKTLLKIANVLSRFGRLPFRRRQSFSQGKIPDKNTGLQKCFELPAETGPVTFLLS